MFSIENKDKTACCKCRNDKHKHKQTIINDKDGAVILFERNDKPRLTYKAYHNKAFDL